MRYDKISLLLESEVHKMEMDNENMAIYKGYLRKLMRDLKDVKKALINEDLNQAKKIIDILIEDTQQDLES